ncbi:hypothetical protein TWF173_003160 [Orbilia oligospora]|nr:hypothetical protein TWF173_003160 [Orbilia oligospora]
MTKRNMGDKNSNPDAPARIWQPFIPIPIDTGPRIQYLRKLLEKPEENARQLKNIEAVLKALENGETPHECYQNGQPVDFQKADLKISMWFEGGRMLASSCS